MKSMTKNYIYIGVVAILLLLVCAYIVTNKTGFTIVNPGDACDGNYRTCPTGYECKLNSYGSAMECIASSGGVTPPGGFVCDEYDYWCVNDGTIKEMACAVITVIGNCDPDQVCNYDSRGIAIYPSTGAFTTEKSLSTVKANVCKVQTCDDYEYRCEPNKYDNTKITSTKCGVLQTYDGEACDIDYECSKPVYYSSVELSASAIRSNLCRPKSVNVTECTTDLMCSDGVTVLKKCIDGMYGAEETCTTPECTTDVKCADGSVKTACVNGKYVLPSKVCPVIPPQQCKAYEEMKNNVCSFSFMNIFTASGAKALWNDYMLEIIVIFVLIGVLGYLIYYNFIRRK